MKEYKRDKRVLIPRDEFEEEAGEGLGRLSREEADADLLELKARIEGRLRRPRAIWLPAAAAVALLLVASALVVSLLREKRPGAPELAEAQASEGSTFLDTAYIAMAGPIEKADYPSSEEVTTARFVPPLVPEAVADYEIPGKADTGYDYIADKQAVDEIVKEEPVVTLIVAEEEEADEVVVQALPQMAQDAMKARAVSETRDEKKAMTVDEAAKRAQQLAAKDDTAKEEASAIANREAAEREYAVSGQPVISSGPAPVGGWEKYEAWTARNISYPQGIEPVVRQVVTVSFIVQPDSTLSDLRVVSSPGEPFSREAFRLLREGPKWVPGGSGWRAAAEEVVLKIVFR